VLVAVAVAVSRVVDRAAGVTRLAVQARAEADTLAMLAVPALFALDAVALLEPHRSGGSPWRPWAGIRRPTPPDPR